MPIGVVAAVLLGALLHAVWNALVRAASDKFLNTVLIVGGAGVWTACWLPFAPIPAVESWPYLAVSVLIHVAYFSFVALSYREGDMSFVYPIMRGSAPALSTAAAAVFVHEFISPNGWMGVLLVSLGVLILSVDSWHSGSLKVSVTALALTNAGVIVIYTLVDGVGVRLSRHPVSYTGWMFFLTAIPLLTASFARHGRRVTDHLRFNWGKGLIGGACTLGSYGLALWAMTQAPIGLVAALRETSVIFGTLIAAVFLKEHVSLLRCLSILAVTGGAVAIKMS
ncbi:MAG TPA: DMT family transporter [Thermodesulfobacteriota bacterium]|nr:DMT family transporter [Thermodesulfobacteriota bacterium]